MLLEWYIAGPLIGIVFFLFLYLGKSFGISSSFQTTCALVPGLKKKSYFRLNQKDHLWRYAFVIGLLLGGAGMRIYSGDPLIPDWMMHNGQMSSLGWTLLIPGGFLVGFGVRYAGGCTSGHAITGLSFLQWRSLVAVIGFFIGGLLVTHLLINDLI